MHVLPDERAPLAAVIDRAGAGLVGGREHFDDRDDLEFGQPPDLDPHVADFLLLDRQRHRRRFEQRHAPADRRQLRPAPARSRDGHIRQGPEAVPALPLNQFQLFVELRHVGLGQALVEGIATVGDEPRMKVQPPTLVFDVRVHSRKRAGHDRPSFGCLGPPALIVRGQRGLAEATRRGTNKGGRKGQAWPAPHFSCLFSHSKRQAGGGLAMSPVFLRESKRRAELTLRASFSAFVGLVGRFLPFSAFRADEQQAAMTRARVRAGREAPTPSRTLFRARPSLDRVGLEFPPGLRSSRLPARPPAPG